MADTYYELFKASPDNYKLRESAGSAYKKGLDLDPLNSHYLKKFADFLLNAGKPEFSSEIYKKASHVISKTRIFSSRPVEFTNAKSYKDIADIAFSGHDIDKAMVFYKMAENFKENDRDAGLGQVRCYMKMSLMRKAMDKYRGIGPSPKAKSALFASLGEYCLYKGLLETAQDFSKKSIALDPGNPEGFQLRYKVSKQIRGRRASMEEFRDVLDFNSAPVSVNDADPAGIEIRLGIRAKLNKQDIISQDVVLAPGIYEFNIEAKGDMAQGTGPHIVVKFNGLDAMDAYVNSEDWAHYPGIIVVDYPVNRFEILYDNDYYNPETKEDRNLYIGSIKLKVL